MTPRRAKAVAFYLAVPGAGVVVGRGVAFKDTSVECLRKSGSPAPGVCEVTRWARR